MRRLTIEELVGGERGDKRSRALGQQKMTSYLESEHCCAWDIEFLKVLVEIRPQPHHTILRDSIIVNWSAGRVDSHNSIVFHVFTASTECIVGQFVVVTKSMSGEKSVRVRGEASNYR